MATTTWPGSSNRIETLTNGKRVTLQTNGDWIIPSAFFPSGSTNTGLSLLQIQYLKAASGSGFSYAFTTHIQFLNFDTFRHEDATAQFEGAWELTWQGQEFTFDEVMGLGARIDDSAPYTYSASEITSSGTDADWEAFIAKIDALTVLAEGVRFTAVLGDGAEPVDAPTSFTAGDPTATIAPKVTYVIRDQIDAGSPDFSVVPDSNQPVQVDADAIAFEAGTPSYTVGTRVVQPVRVDVDIEFDAGTPALLPSVYAPPPIVIPPIEPITITEGIARDEILPVATGGIAPYQYRIPTLPSGVTFDVARRELSISANTASNIYALQYQVSDSYGLSQTRSFQLIVREDVRPKFRVEVDWDNDGNFNNAHSDITTDLLAIGTCKRGRDFSGQRYGQAIAGLFTCILEDDESKYDRFNRSSPLFGKVLPGREVRVSILVSGDYSQEWGGVLDDVQPKQRIGRRTVRMSAIGALSLLLDTEINESVRSRITGANAMRRVLNDSGIDSKWIGTLNSGTRIDRWWARGENGFNAVRSIAETVLGIINEGRDGTINLEARTFRESTASTLAKVFTTETPSASEKSLTRLEFADPLQHLATVVVVNVQNLQTLSSDTIWEYSGTPIFLSAGESTTIRIPYPGDDAPLNHIAVTSWDTVTYSANTQTNGAGADRTAQVSLTQSASANLMTATFTNDSAGDVYLRSISIDATVLGASGSFERRFADADSLALYGEHLFRSIDTFLTDGEAEAFAGRVLARVSEPLPRVTLTYEDTDNLTRCQLSDTVAVTDNGRTSRYFVESIDHQWNKGGDHRVTLKLTERTGLVDAIAPSIVINPIPSDIRGSTFMLSAALSGGAYDRITSYRWAVSGGTLNDRTSATPTWTRPTTVNRNAEYTITVTITVSGTGTVAKSGTTDTATDSEIGTVVVAPVGPQNVMGEFDTSTTLQTSWDAVTDAVSYEYQYRELGGAWSDVALTSNLETRITELRENLSHEFRVRAVNTAGRSAFSTITIYVDAIAPTVMIDAIPTGVRGTNATLGLTAIGGNYDRLTYAWTVGGGTLDDATSATPRWTRPTPAGNSAQYVISVTVTAHGHGTAVRDGSEDTAMDTETGFVVFAASRPQNVRESSVFDTFISMQWDSVDGAVSYEHQHRAVGGSWPVDVETTTFGSTTLSDLEEATAYEFRVRSVNAVNAKSQWVTISTRTTPVTFDTPGTYRFTVPWRSANVSVRVTGGAGGSQGQETYGERKPSSDVPIGQAVSSTSSRPIDIATVAVDSTYFYIVTLGTGSDISRLRVRAISKLTKREVSSRSFLLPESFSGLGSINGMVSIGNNLYIKEISRVHVFAKSTGTEDSDAEFLGALGGLATDGSALYMSHRITGGPNDTDRVNAYSTSGTRISGSDFLLDEEGGDKGNGILAYGNNRFFSMGSFGRLKNAGTTAAILRQIYIYDISGNRQESDEFNIESSDLPTQTGAGQLLLRGAIVDGNVLYIAVESSRIIADQRLYAYDLSRVVPGTDGGTSSAMRAMTTVQGLGTDGGESPAFPTESTGTISAGLSDVITIVVGDGGDAGTGGEDGDDGEVSITPVFST